MADKKELYPIQITWEGEREPDEYLVQATQKEIEEIEANLTDWEADGVVESFNVEDPYSEPQSAAEALADMKKRYEEIEGGAPVESEEEEAEEEEAEEDAP